MPRRVLEGIVTSTKMEKTVTVEVKRTYMHPLYKKFLRVSKKYHAHNENPIVKVGDIVKIRETRPIAKTVTWEVLENK